MSKGKKDIVFVVDDNPENIKLLGNMLEEKGYEPMVFLSAMSALKVIGQEKPELRSLVSQPGWPEWSGYQ